MIKLDIEDFIFEIKDELSCYETIGQKGADKWESEFRKWLEGSKSKKNIFKKGSRLQYAIGDESEIFDIADEYLQAFENNKIKEYWDKFQ